MIESMLNLVSLTGRDLPPPDLNKLVNEYFHAANIRAETTDVPNPEQDCNRVITLRPDIGPYLRATRVEQIIFKGYFAYGRLECPNVIFEIYSSHSSVKSKFPQKSLQIAIGLFALKLLQEGYALNPHSVNFVTHIDNSVKK